MLLAATLTVGVGALVTTSTAAEAPRTWVVDAVDDGSGNRWDSVDTGTSVVTIRVGDTVEWQFDRATQGHDLVSLAPSQSWETVWPTALQEYRDAGGPSVTYTFDQPGTYRYECSLHGPMMSGTIVVVADDGTNQPPTADPVVEPRTGPAPLVVHATANASDPDGDVVSVAWELGAGGAPAYTDHAMVELATPGSYVVRLRVSDSRGGLHVEEFPVTVTGDGQPGTDPPTDGALPEIAALAAPAQGTAPLAVAFSTQVTTRGEVHPYSVGLDDYPSIAGEAVLVRSRGRTYTSLDVTGTKPSARHGSVHVHEQACDDELGGAHFRFDTTQPFAEPNEIWPLFTPDATGASGPVEVTKAVRAGPKAVSIVVHDPDNAARRIGCADLVPGTADLTYSWAFGDGTTATVADPDHTYAAPGTYTATVTVAHASGEHAHRPRPGRRVCRAEEGHRDPRRRPSRHPGEVRPGAPHRAVAAREGAGTWAPRRTTGGHRRRRQPRGAEVALRGAPAMIGAWLASSSSRAPRSARRAMRLRGSRRSCRGPTWSPPRTPAG